MDRLRRALLGAALVGNLAACGLDLEGTATNLDPDGALDDAPHTPSDAAVVPSPDASDDVAPDAQPDADARPEDVSNDANAPPPDAPADAPDDASPAPDAADASDAGGPDASDAADANPPPPPDAGCVTAQDCALPTGVCIGGACLACGDPGTKGHPCSSGGKCFVAPSSRCQ